MSVFARNAFAPGSSFHPLFRLLDDYDSYSNQSQASRNHRSLITSFQPKFDVRELEDAYELHGELPGISKDDVHIDFSDAHTLHISGRIERSYTSGERPAGLIKDTKAPEVIAESKDGADSSAEKRDHRATVGDEKPTESTSDSTSAVEKKEDAEPAEEKKASDKPVDKAKYWISERSVGEFSRTFSFPGQVQQDAVTATLQDGVLTVRIPKTPKTDGRRRVQIN